MDVEVLRPDLPGYPSRLHDLSRPPSTLWIAGPWRATRRAVAVVGARAAHRESTALARALAARLAQSEVDVLSGGAAGVDAAAHEGALAAGGTTVAVLGTGIDRVYPAQNADLFREIAEGPGALLSQFAPGMGPIKRAFPARNAVIAALAEAVVVVEASSASGSLHTADAARRLGRPVIAVAGSFGADALIARGAALSARSVEDVMAHLDGRPVAAPLPPPPSDPEAARLYAALDRTPRDLGDLAARVGLSISRCAALAASLELGGLAARATGDRFARLASG